ncbi:MAG: PIG-L family deacetylase [Acidobacteria bacterium]|nr:PIG-L family deacetylase [Acidobacteriota bacterium]
MVVAPHMDDEVLGGTIARRVSEGDEVYVCFIANRVYDHQYDEQRHRFEMQCAQQARRVLGYQHAEFLGLPDERLDACVQQVLVPLENYLRAIQPEVVYLNHRGDNHQDHRAVFAAAMVALRPAANPGVRTVACYETLSSTDQAPPAPETAFLPNCYVNVAPYLEKKLAALRCYQTEVRQFPHPRSEEAVTILAKRRGCESGFPAAEAFLILRDRWA